MLVLLAVVYACVAVGVRWHVLTSSYQIFLIGVFAGGLLTATVTLGVHDGTWVSRVSALVFLLGILVTGVVQVFFFHMLGGDRYVRQLMVLLGNVWG